MSRLCLGCHKPLPADASARRKYHDAKCADAYHNRIKNPARHAELAEARAQRRAAVLEELGPRFCALPGCEVDISDRDPRTLTCSPEHQARMSYLRKLERRRLAEAQAKP